MRWIVAMFAGLVGCDAAAPSDDTPGDERTIEFLVPGTLDPLPQDTPVEIYVRTQGAFGCEIDVRVYGVPIDGAANFSISFVGPDDHTLAEQKFLPTSTAEPQDDGSFSMADLPIVFFDDVAQAEVDGAPATARAMMMTEPPAIGELPVTLALRE